MSRETIQRPTSVTVIGWLYIGFGILGLLSGVLFTAMSFLMRSTMTGAQMPPPSPDEPAFFRLMTSMFDWFWLFGVAQVVVMSLMIWSGAAFLRLRAWARTVVEIIAWLGLTYNVGFGVLWCLTLLSMTQNVPRDSTYVSAFPWIMLAMGIVMIIAFSIPLVVIIRVVRGRVVRDAIAAAA